LSSEIKFYGKENHGVNPSIAENLEDLQELALKLASPLSERDVRFEDYIKNRNYCQPPGLNFPLIYRPHRYNITS